jgi:hypothetical protein
VPEVLLDRAQELVLLKADIGACMVLPGVRIMYVALSTCNSPLLIIFFRLPNWLRIQKTTRRRNHDLGSPEYSYLREGDALLSYAAMISKKNQILG